MNKRGVSFIVLIAVAIVVFALGGLIVSEVVAQSPGPGFEVSRFINANECSKDGVCEANSIEVEDLIGQGNGIVCVNALGKLFRGDSNCDNLADLIVDSVSVIVGNETPGGFNVSISARIGNNGSITAGSSHTYFEVPGIWSGERLTDSVPPGETRGVYRFYQEFEPGTYSLRVTADIRGEVEEEREDNNLDIVEFTIGEELPDLTIQSLQAFIGNQTNSTTYNVSIQTIVQNIGNGPADESTTRVIVLGVDLKNVFTGAINPGQSRTLRTYHLVPIGNNTVRSIADILGVIQESYEDNNQRELEFSVP